MILITSFSKNFQKKVDIGVYAHDADKLHRINANISIITLGGMDQGKLFWPNFWLKENWSKFDFGILPGNNWIKMWKNSSWFIHSRPKKAILKIEPSKIEYTMRNTELTKNLGYASKVGIN